MQQKTKEVRKKQKDQGWQRLTQVTRRTGKV